MGKRAKTKREKKERFEKERRESLQTISKSKNPWESFWRRIDFWIYTACFIALICFPFIKKDALVYGDQAVIHTSMGDIEVELYKNDAPKTVANFVGLSERGFYNNLTWHRVIKGFMIQGGDPNGDGTGGESIYGDYFEDEINPEALGLARDQIQKLEEKGYVYNYTLHSHKVEDGSLAMANSGPNTNGSQFFIVTEKDQPHLNGQHTVFGKVTKGLDIAVKISEAPADGESDRPFDPVYIKSIEIK